MLMFYLILNVSMALAIREISMEDKPMYDQDIDEQPGEVTVPILFSGIASREVTKNPFRKKGRLQYILKQGALYMFSDADKADFEAYLKEFTKKLTSQYEKIPYTEHTRQLYKRNFDKIDNMTDGGMIVHYWTTHYRGLESVIIELKEIRLHFGLIFGKNAPVIPNELLRLAMNQVPLSHDLYKKFLQLASHLKTLEKEAS